MRTRRRTSGENAGSALVIAMVLITGLMFMTFAYLQASTAAEKRVNGDMDDERAFFLAEAGLNEAFDALRVGETGAIGDMVWDDVTATWTATTPVFLGGGILWVAAEDLGGDRYRLTSTGMAGTGRHSISAIVEADAVGAPLFSATLNSKEKMTLNQGVVIDSFDSSAGTYASQPSSTYNGHTYVNENGDVRSNSDIELNSLATVFGDAIHGVLGSVIHNSNTYISGSEIEATEPFTFDPISYPSFPAQGSLSVPTNGSQALAAGDYYFDAGLTINKNATLTITGPANVVVSDFTGGKDGNLLIDATNGPVTVYVENGYSHISGFEADAVPGSPMALAFMIEGTQDVVFPSSTNIRGAYYAPNANIVFANANECWGAFAANRIDMSNDMRFHFDEALLDHWASSNGQNGGEVTLLGWSEVQVWPDHLREDRRDPMTIFGLSRGQLMSPYDWRVWTQAQAQ